jgi:hypothetical protein
MNERKKERKEERKKEEFIGTSNDNTLSAIYFLKK